MQTGQRPQEGTSWLAPYALFAGILVSFGSCSGAGYLVSARNCFAHFIRFHFAITPTSLFYPTARQVGALGQAAVRQDRIAVVIGGHSVMWGFGQSSPAVWTKHLQALLGPEYEVINFAVQGDGTSTFGQTGAELLLRHHPRLLFVTHAPLTGQGVEGVTDGPYHYLFWDAYARGLLPPDPEREAQARLLEQQKQKDETFQERRRGLLLDRWTFSRDLWTDVAYRHFSTVWTAPAPTQCLRARRKWPDFAAWDEKDLAARYPPKDDDRFTQSVLVQTHLARQQLLKVDGDGRIAGAGPLAPALRARTPPGLRDRTLYCVLHVSPYYRERLTEEERGRYYATRAAAVTVFEQVGFGAVEVGRDYSVLDFLDLYHLSEEGGARMAAEVAPKVREMARRLGYTATGEETREKREGEGR